MEDKGDVVYPNADLRQGTQQVILQLDATLKLMRQAKPNDRSETDRRYAIAITDLEKVIAYIHTYC